MPVQLERRTQYPGQPGLAALGTKWSMVIVFWVTISSWGKDSVVGKLITNCSASTTGASGSTGSSGRAGS